MLPLTARQEQVLQFVTSYIDNNGYPPSQREIAEHLGITNPAVIKHLDAIEKKGFLKRESSSRAIALTTPLNEAASLPIIGTVRAGQLSYAAEDIQGYLTLSRDHLHGGKFLLRVRGESMIEAAICDGDLALIRPQPRAENRDIVVAMLNGEATLKEFYWEHEYIRLQPRNSEMDPIFIKRDSGDFSIIGKVVGIFRSME